MLTEKGVHQAKKVAEKLKTYKIDMLFSSPVKRAIQTAQIISEMVGIKFLIEGAFGEMKLGPWDGLSEKKISKLYPREWKTWQEKPEELKLSNRETLKELLERVLKGLQKIYQSNNYQTVAVITHVAIIRVLLLWNKKMSLNLYKTIPIPNVEVFEIRINSYPYL